MAYDPKIHHRRSIRLKGYDYSSPNFYFITICTQHRKHLFGEIIDGEMYHSAIGRMIEDEWLKTEERYPMVQDINHVVMPNHFHSIIRVKQEHEYADPSARTTPFASIADVTAYFKYHTTRLANLQEKLWQRNYYEHIIRNAADFSKIDNYISNNPFVWDKDCMNEKNIDKSQP